jgi:selenocysteine lyase/cysteine desulfurase
VSHTLNFSPGDEIVISSLDHEANIASWVSLAERQNLILKWWTPSDTTNPKLTVENLQGLLSEKTRLLTFTHTSNILGTITDVKAIASYAHQQCPDVLVCVDGVAYAPHRQIDVADLGVDFYSFSWYKVYGPHVAMLYASQKAQKQMKSMGHYFNPSASLADKIGLAAGSYELVASIPVLVDHLQKVGAWDGVKEQEAIIQKVLLDYLASREDVTIYGETSADPSIRLPIISFKVRGWGSREIVETVEKDTNLGFRWGSFYSQRLTKGILGLDPVDGIVRVSMAHYNTGK